MASHPKKFSSQALIGARNEIGDDARSALILLRTLHVGEIFVRNNSQTDFAAIMTGIHRLVNLTPCLEILEIEGIAGNYQSTLPKPELGQLVPARRRAFLQLRRVSTMSVNARRPFLLAFLKFNSKTLEDLEFWDMDILDDDWASVLAHIREIKFSRLRRFKISWLDNESESQDMLELLVEDYVLHISNLNPVVEQQGRRKLPLLKSNREEANHKGGRRRHFDPDLMIRICD